MSIVNWKVARELAWIMRYQGSQPKGTLLSTYLKILLKSVGKPLHGHVYSEKLLGYTVHFFDYDSIELLFEEVFITDEYRFQTDNPAPYIVDCGSNIGMSILYFKKLYPKARILGFEANPKTYGLLKKNLETNQLKDVEVFNYALSDKRQPVHFYFNPERPGDMGASALREGAREAEVTVDGVLLSDYITGPVDFLKMDIEGSEDVVIPELARTGKLPLINQMIMEYHHHVQPEEDRLSTLLGALEGNGFGYQISTFCQFEKRKEQQMLIYAYRK